MSRARSLLEDGLRELRQAVITPYGLFRMIQDMYPDPGMSQYFRTYKSLIKARVIDEDDDYSGRAMRILVAHDQPIEDIVCLADPLCHVSHLSAMQWWGLTDRVPKEIIFTRANALESKARLMEMVENDPRPQPPKYLLPRRIKHPDSVRGCSIRMIDSKPAGNSVVVQGRQMRLATIGQTFLDMLRRQDLCGGMRHVLEIYEEHAGLWVEEIVTAVDEFPKKIVKCRAGYILSERLKIHHEKIDAWQASAPQRGGSCKLDSSRDYAPVYSEDWSLSLNV
ncbi:MAG: hypothetical protein OXF73_08235 [Gammaproteobacteria bacterium]|nr:hypothetical protein [Gammaproteobacteria bacterium]